MRLPLPRTDRSTDPLIAATRDRQHEVRSGSTAQTVYRRPTPITQRCQKAVSKRTRRTLSTLSITSGNEHSRGVHDGASSDNRRCSSAFFSMACHIHGSGHRHILPCRHEPELPRCAPYLDCCFPFYGRRDRTVADIRNKGHQETIFVGTNRRSESKPVAKKQLRNQHPRRAESGPSAVRLRRLRTLRRPGTLVWSSDRLSIHTMSYRLVEG